MSVQDDLNPDFLIRLISIHRIEQLLVRQDGMALSAEHRLELDVFVLEPGPAKGQLLENVYRLDFHDVDEVVMKFDGGRNERDLNWDVDEVTLEELIGGRYQLKFENGHTEIIISFHSVDKELISINVGRA